MSVPDSFYLALCMTVLLVGAVYWVWTQIQFVQRKVNVLENIVYELKTLCSRQSTPPPEPLPPVSYPPAPSSVLGEDDDLLHETLHKEVEEVEANDIQPLPEDEVEEMPVVEFNAPPSSPIPEPPVFEEDLQPGGVGSGVEESSLNSALDTMTVKELRRLAEQRGIEGVKEKKRKDLIEAIRATPTPSFFG